MQSSKKGGESMTTDVEKGTFTAEGGKSFVSFDSSQHKTSRLLNGRHGGEAGDQAIFGSLKNRW